MDVKEKIKDLWNECTPHTKDDFLMACAREKRLSRSTTVAVKQYYIYAQDYKEGEAEIVLEVMHDALRSQNERITDKIVA